MAKISVLVPVCNVEDYLERCLDSIRDQTFSDLEIICMDDGSTDNSGMILDQYADQDERFRVVHKENSGYGSTMNQALFLAKGEYIGIVESDDYIAEDMFETLYEAIEKWQLDFVKTDYYQLWDREDGTEQLHYRVLTENPEMYNRVIEPNVELEAYFLQKFTWNALYRKEFLKKHYIQYQETPGASYQDNGFWFQTFYFAKRVMFLNQAFYRYKQDNPNSSINSDRKVYAMKNEYDFIREFLANQKEADKRLYQICFHFRIDGCLYTLSRLADQYKQELAETIRDECRFYDEIGEADFSGFTEEKQEIIRQICEDPAAYVREQIQRNMQLRRKLEGYRAVVIYGAGSYGKSVYWRIVQLLDKSCSLALAVTDLKGEKQYYYSHVVKEIAEFFPQRENCLVILSVKYDSAAYQEMADTLRRMQFQNVIFCEEFFI